ncbi:MAG: site-specific integrase [Deltaproteobacteria bacterium]|nr:MAG: site-specific integrase [Deltaproteobacteria bacterium]
MTVRVRKYKRGGFEVDIRVMLPDGKRHRERRRAPVSSRSAARRWGEARERHLALHGLAKPRKEVPTLAEFKPRFMVNHCVANQHKPAGIETKEAAFRNYLLPIHGRKKLDEFVQEDVARLKAKMAGKAPNTVNNVLTVLNQTLKCAVEWGVIDAMPVQIRLLKVQKGVPKFYDFDQYEWLIEAARALDPRIEIVVLLGGDAGLRRGEIIALEQADCDVRRGLISVERSEWKGKVTATKGMECRVVPMTARLRAALARHRHLIGDRVLYTDAGAPVTAKVLQKWMAKAQRRAKLRATGGMHLLRHTFCSHLAMRGAPALSIQRLAGHKNLQTTLRYMHLSPGETERAIRLLEGADRRSDRGDIWETDTSAIEMWRYHR